MKKVNLIKAVALASLAMAASANAYYTEVEGEYVLHNLQDVPASEQDSVDSYAAGATIYSKDVQPTFSQSEAAFTDRASSLGVQYSELNASDSVNRSVGVFAEGYLPNSPFYANLGFQQSNADVIRGDETGEGGDVDIYQGSVGYFVLPNTRIEAGVVATDINFDQAGVEDKDYVDARIGFKSEVQLLGPWIWEGAVTFGDSDDEGYMLSGEYFVNPMTSLGLEYRDNYTDIIGLHNVANKLQDETYEVSARQFFTDNYSIAAKYAYGEVNGQDADNLGLELALRY